MEQKRSIEVRSIPTILESEGNRVIRGFIPYNSRSYWMGGFYEEITPTAFNKTLSDGATVYAYMDHDSSRVLGNTKNGSLILRSTEAGLDVECILPNTSYAADAYELIKNGYCTTMSFGFNPIKTRSVMESGKEIQYLQEVKLVEVSFIVSQPAYGETASEARSIFQYRNLDYDKLSETLSKKELDETDISVIEDAVNRLNSLLPKKEEVVITPAEPEVTKDTDAVQFLTSLLQDVKKLKGN